MQAKDLIYSAFRVAGILLGPKETYSDDDASDGLEVLNGMLDAWKADRLAVYAILRSLFTLTAGKGSESNPYSIGLNGHPDFLIERPEQIYRASLILDNSSPTVEVPLSILNEQQYQALAPKDLTGPIPTRLYYRPLVPNGQIILWAVPTVAYQIALYLWRTVDEFTSASQPVFLPPAYREAIEYNLAIRLAARYPESHLTQMAVQIAKDAISRIKTINQPELLMRCEAALLPEQGRYNIFSNRPVSS
jgi:hypothetical protein